MAVSSVGDPSPNLLVGVINAAHELAATVGPAWGVVIVVAICIFLPRYGVLIHLAQLWKEDRSDERKRKVESERLLSKHRSRQSVQAKLPNKKES